MHRKIVLKWTVPTIGAVTLFVLLVLDRGMARALPIGLAFAGGLVQGALIALILEKLTRDRRISILVATTASILVAANIVFAFSEWRRLYFISLALSLLLAGIALYFGVRQQAN